MAVRRIRLLNQQVAESSLAQIRADSKTWRALIGARTTQPGCQQNKSPMVRYAQLWCS